MKTTYSTGTVIEAEWLNEVNVAVFDAIGDGTNAPTTAAEVKTNLGIPGTIGDVSGPASAVDNRIAVFDLTTGKLIKDSGSLVSDLIPKSVLNAAGDLIYATSAASPARLAVGTPFQKLRVNSAGTAPEWNSLAPTVQVFTSSGTWNKPAGLVAAIVEVVGGGGGSGGNAATGAGEASGAAGGGAGGYSRKLIAAADLGATETVTVGVGGTAGAAGNNPGGNGGTSSFGAHLSATGGNGTGGAAASNATRPWTSGGIGGSGSGGDINVAGCGGDGGFVAGAVSVGGGGNGGASYFGGAGKSGISGTIAQGAAGTVGGGGAGGALGSNQSANAGAAGGDGVVIVTEFY